VTLVLIVPTKVINLFMKMLVGSRGRGRGEVGEVGKKKELIHSDSAVEMGVGG
jgi:hypothetical protein